MNTIRNDGLKLRHKDKIYQQFEIN